MSRTVTELVIETGATRADVLALVDQLVEIDGSEAVVTAENAGDTELTAGAADIILDQLNS